MTEYTTATHDIYSTKLSKAFLDEYEIWYYGNNFAVLCSDKTTSILIYMF